LSDVDAQVIRKFGALNEPTKGVKRYYFLLDENGKIIWRSVTGQLITIDPLLEQLTAAVKGAGQ
jgi:peroxiredoxin